MTSRDLELSCQRIEMFLNQSGHVPVVSTVTGSVRVLGGNAEILYGIVSAAHHFACCIVSDDAEKADYAEEAWRDLQFALNGLFNVARGALEILPFLNMLTLVYDLLGLRFPYQAEHETVTHPIDLRN